MLPTVLGGYVFLLPILSAVMSLTALGIAYFHSKKGKESAPLLVFLLFVLVLLTGHALISTQCHITQKALLSTKLLYLVLSFAPAVFYHIAAVHVRRVHTQLLYAGYAAAILFTILTWAPTFFDGIQTYVYGCFAQSGWLHSTFSLYSAVYMCLALGVTVQHHFGKNIQQSQKSVLSPHVILVASVTILLGATLLLAYGIDTTLILYGATPILSAILVLSTLQSMRFQLRIVAIQTFVVYVAIASFIQIFMVNSTPLRVLATIVTTFVILFGVLVTHNTMVELEMRTKGDRLAKYLANANERLRNLDKQKTEFVSIASHQLRGPIATITGYTSMITEGSYGPVPEKLVEPLARIFESGRRISIMVDDFLNVSRIEQGMMLYRKDAIDINALLHTVVEEQRPIAEKRGLTILYAPFTDNKVVLQVDGTKLALVFQNLLDNAIKFTPKGSVTVSLQENDTHDKVFITFSDTGVGISQDEVNHLFTKFNRASNANTASVYGAGLGLYIAREIIKAHDGWIHVSSGGLGQGATLTIELPVHPMPAITPHKQL